MKARILSGAAIAAATVSLALAGVSPAEAKHKAHRTHKPAAEKHACGGKNGCPAAGEAKEKATPTAEKPAEAKPAEAKPVDAKPADAKPAEKK